VTAHAGTDPSGGVGRAAVTITLWNLVSRLLGFVRVLATASALGVAVLGDTYHRTNQVSNLLFELLAGGMLFAVLVPTFVDHLTRDPHTRVSQVAGAIATRAAVAMAAVAAVGLLAAEPLMVLLAAGAPEATRDDQVALGVFLLWFVLPQLVLYAVGSVASALLQADRRFVATSMAPACNSLVVTATMVAFALTHDPARGLALTTGEKVLLGGGTLLGTVVMTAVPLIAARRAGYGLRPGWAVEGSDLRPLVGRGLWAAGHVGLNQILVLVTVVLAGQVAGGVIAYQTAFTFFLLPHALLAHPIFTALYPRLAAAGAAGETGPFARDLARGLRAMVALVLPAAAVLAAVAAPALSLVRIGQLDDAGVELIAAVLASYLLGVGGYSTFFLLTRASYALGDARRPTLVNLVVTAVTIAGLAGASARYTGTAVLVAFGVVTAVGATGGSIALHRLVSRRLDQPGTVAGPILKAAGSSVLAAGAAWAAAATIGWTTWPRALGAVVAGAAAGAGGYAIGMVASRSPDLELVVGRLGGLRSKLP
jgi:putative peptidoglycan lipid II flippase